jgi:hypothetical protein
MEVNVKSTIYLMIGGKFLAIALCLTNSLATERISQVFYFSTTVF